MRSNAKATVFRKRPKKSYEIDIPATDPPWPNSRDYRRIRDGVPFRAKRITRTIGPTSWLSAPFPVRWLLKLPLEALDADVPGLRASALTVRLQHLSYLGLADKRLRLALQAVSDAATALFGMLLGVGYDALFLDGRQLVPAATAAVPVRKIYVAPPIIGARRDL